MSSPARPPITDSPWFWVALFSLIGLIGLVAISGQYGKRQSRLERQYQARERISTDTVGDVSLREYSTAENTLIPLWPLGVLLFVALTIACAMLRREARRLPVSAGTEGGPP